MQAPTAAVPGKRAVQAKMSQSVSEDAADTLSDMTKSRKRGFFTSNPRSRGELVDTRMLCFEFHSGAKRQKGSDGQQAAPPPEYLDREEAVGVMRSMAPVSSPWREGAVPRSPAQPTAAVGGLWMGFESALLTDIDKRDSMFWQLHHFRFVTVRAITLPLLADYCPGAET